MAHIQVRPATNADVKQLVGLDHNYSTDYVWQMEARDDSGVISVAFRASRLPRSVRVTFPRDPHRLSDAWTKRLCFLVAEDEGQLKGYVNLTASITPETAWIADLAVDRRFRRSGVGSVLVAAASHWARQNQFKRIVLEMQSKNYPAICFAQKNGFVFCGYNDRYYPNQDVALFFGTLFK